MPGYNGTGPAGCGPMTGRGTDFDRDVDRRRNLRSRRRYLMGDDRGICYGIRRRFRDRVYSRRYGQQMGYPYREYFEEFPTEADREYHQKLLKEEAGYLQKELRSIEKRIEYLKNNDDEC